MPTAQKLLEPYLAGGYERENGDLDLHCPIHGDKRRSAVVNFKTKEWYCNSCEDGGSLSGLIARRAEWLPPAGGSANPTKKGRTLPLPDSARLDGWQSALIGNEGALEWLETKRGINLETIQKYGIGWDGRRYAMPIYDEKGILRNIRCYSSVLDPKILNWPGWGSPPRLFPMATLLGDPKVIFICEGEWDALLANQQGIPTVTGTGGVKSMGRWYGNWSDWFRDRVVFICFDCDDEGRIGARRVAAKLARVTRKLRVVELPFPIGSHKDLTDYILEGGTYPKLRKLGTQPKALRRAAPRYHEINFPKLREGGATGRPVAIEATLSGVYSTQLSLPIKLKADCNIDWDPKRCQACPMNALNGKMVHDTEHDDDLHIDLLGGGKSAERDREFKRRMKIPQNCPMVEITTSNKSAWDAEIRNGSDLQEQSLPMLLKHDGNTPEVNHLYRWFGKLVTSSRGSRSLFVADKFEDAKADLDNFLPNDDAADSVREWIGQFSGQPEEKIEAISDLFERRVTQIFGQPLLHMAIDLVYHSVLRFPVFGKVIVRGWMEALAVGETRSGKSTMAQRLQEMYDYGTLISGENTTVAGLLSGVEKRAGLTKDGSWALTVGELPLCDRRLLVIDEAQGLPIGQIGQMSDVRSRGKVNVKKIRSGEIDARVRLIWLANGRKNRYKYGIDALSDQMGAAEDLARIDIPLFISHDIGDSLSTIRDEYDELPEHELEIIRWIVLWAWSRRPENVQWTQAADEALFNLKGDLADDYSTSSVPVFPENEAHIRLARMAVAVAARLFSSPDGFTLQVRSEHVGAAYELYKRFLMAPSLGVTDIKEEEIAIEEAAGENSEKLRDILISNHPEVLQRVATGTFDRFLTGASMENQMILSELGALKAIALSGQDYTVSKWAQEIAKDIERERR